MYSDAEMEDVLFPHMMTDEELDEQFDNEPDCEDEVYDDDFEEPQVEKLGVSAYAHHNECAFQMWWLEEGRW
jgi:hypothetical protein